ncbi:uncharacterized protein LOC134714399 [Mytilus trossulus]|uniref:uncharacterized protein LOC134714399 n=1 Tax=Mytilus trossulus TaxID=6551 RepID=UPI0030077143
MGAKLTKFNCFKGCGKGNSKTRASNTSVSDQQSQQKARSSADIINELKTIGIISKKAGGVKFSVEIPDEKPRKKKPRRLPAISCPERQKIQKDTTLIQGSQYDREEKDLMTEIRRIGAIAEKVIIARKSEEKRQNVIARREEIIKRKIKKTEDKLKRDAERLIERERTKKENHVVGEVLPVVSV